MFSCYFFMPWLWLNIKFLLINCDCNYTSIIITIGFRCFNACHMHHCVLALSYFWHGLDNLLVGSRLEKLALDCVLQGDCHIWLLPGDPPLRLQGVQDDSSLISWQSEGKSGLCFGQYCWYRTVMWAVYIHKLHPIGRSIIAIDTSDMFNLDGYRH